MKKSYRVKDKNEFQAILKYGKSFANRELVLYYRKRNDANHFRVGVSVGKKVGHAVKRNQIKRYIRAALFLLKDEIKPEYDLIVIARKPTTEMKTEAIKKSLLHLLNKQKLLNR